MLCTFVRRLTVVAPLACISVFANAQSSNEELAKATQNPLASLISVPFQNNTNFNVGPLDGTQNVEHSGGNAVQRERKLERHYAHDHADHLAARVCSGPGIEIRSRDIQFNAFFSPKESRGWVWGAGAVAQLPTHSNARLGNHRWGLGPTAVALHTEKGSPWVYGALINNIWSITSDTDPKINQMLIQRFLNYNLPGGVYLTSSPLITANWEAPSDQKWTVPLGGGVGKIFRLGKLPVNGQLSAYYNVVRPDNGATWSLRVQLQFLFPKCQG
ncbi:MAG: neuromedin U [Gammaproteobacteria bacterium]